MTFAAFASGMLFMALLLLVGCLIAFRPNARPIPPEAMWIFRVILSLAGGAFAGILTGFLDIRTSFLGWTIRAGGGLAVFIALYRLNPPSLVERRMVLQQRRPIRINIPPERINDKSSEDGDKI
jgi:hypothetical protein